MGDIGRHIAEQMERDKDRIAELESELAESRAEAGHLQLVAHCQNCGGTGWVSEDAKCGWCNSRGIWKDNDAVNDYWEEKEAELAEARAESLEQARIIGMSADREDRLRGEIDTIVKRAEQLEHGSLQAQVNIRKLTAQLAKANGLLNEVDAWRRSYYPQSGGCLIEAILAKREVDHG